MGWLEHPTVTVPLAGVACLGAAAGLALTFLGWQTWRCSRRHIDEAPAAAWDGQPPVELDDEDNDERRERVS